MSARSEFPGVSEFFVDELAAVLGVGRGTAAHKATRAFTWRDSLPATFAALKCGELDERRAQIFADTLEHTAPRLAWRVEQVVLPEAVTLGFDALKMRIRAVLLELDPDGADERRDLAAKNSDVWVEPGADGRATFSAEMDHRHHPNRIHRPSDRHPDMSARHQVDQPTCPQHERQSPRDRARAGLPAPRGSVDGRRHGAGAHRAGGVGVDAHHREAVRRHRPRN
nr:DUF222 domain-containing protein [Petropleomorpha daqingensis]